MKNRDNKIIELITFLLVLSIPIHKFLLTLVMFIYLILLGVINE